MAKTRKIHVKFDKKTDRVLVQAGRHSFWLDTATFDEIMGKSERNADA